MPASRRRPSPSLAARTEGNRIEVLHLHDDGARATFGWWTGAPTSPGRRGPALHRLAGAPRVRGERQPGRHTGKLPNDGEIDAFGDEQI